MGMGCFDSARGWWELLRQQRREEEGRERGTPSWPRRLGNTWELALVDYVGFLYCSLREGMP